MNVAIPIWMFWTFLSVIFLLILLLCWMIWIFFDRRRKDAVLIIDKNKRWKIKYLSLLGRSDININEKEYQLVEKCGLLNSRGKVLYVFSENKPEPMMLEYNSSKWLDSKSLMSIINNKLVRMIVKPQDNLKDIFILLGAIGGLIAGVASIIILLIQVGIITPPV